MNKPNEVRDKPEEWRRIEGWNDYDVSSIGRVRSWKDKSGRPRCIATIKKPAICQGYFKVQLRDRERIGTYFIARLVLMAFKKESHFNEAQGSHLNGNPRDNRIENLAWETPKDNSAHKYDHGTINYGSRCHAAKLNNHQVLNIRERHQRGAKCKAIAKSYKVRTETIRCIVRRRTWKHI